MKSILKVAVAMMALTVSTTAFAEDLSLVCLSSKKSDQNIYHITVAKEQMVSIPEESFSEVPELGYYAVVEVIGQDGMVLLGNDEFAVKAKPTKLNPYSYKFKDLKNKLNYNCDLEQTSETQPGVIRVNSI